MATARFPSPLIKPDVRISRIRLSDRLHGRPTAAASVGLRLRLAIELPLKAADLIRRCEAHRQSPSIPDLRRQACLKSGPFAPPVLPGLGARMALSDSRSDRRPNDDVGARAPPDRVSPDYPHHPSHVPCPIPRRIERRPVDRSPARAAFPVFQAGRHPH